MFLITGCVVQAAADKAKKVTDQKQKDLAQVQDDSEEDSDEDSDDDDRPMTGVAEKSKRDEEAREARKIALIKKANELLKKQKKNLVDAAQEAVNVKVAVKKPSSKTSHRPSTKPPANQKGKVSAVPKKGSAKRSTTEPISTKKASKKVPAKRSATEPVSPKKAPKRQKTATSPGDQRSRLTTPNPAAKNTDVAKGTKLQIRWGNSLYNATVTKVLGDGFVSVCTKDEDPSIAKAKFKIVRLTEEQAKSNNKHGFTNKKANAGFEVAGVHDD